MAARAVVVQIARHHFFAGAGFTDDQHGGVGGSQPIEHALQSERRRIDQHRLVGGERLGIVHGRLLSTTMGKKSYPSQWAAARG